MQRFNLHTAELTTDPGDPDGYHARHASVGRAIGASLLAGRAYEVPERGGELSVSL